MYMCLYNNLCVLCVGCKLVGMWAFIILCAGASLSHRVCKFVNLRDTPKIRHQHPPPPCVSVFLSLYLIKCTSIRLCV